MAKPVNSTVHFAAKPHLFTPLAQGVASSIAQTAVCQYVANTRIFQFLNSKVGRATARFVAGTTAELAGATAGGQVGATLGAGLAQAVCPGTEFVGAAAGRVLGTAVGGYLVAKKVRKSEQPFLGRNGYLRDTAVYLGAAGGVNLLAGPASGVIVRAAAGGTAALSAKAAYNAKSNKARATYSALCIASSGLLLSPGVAQAVETGLRNATFGQLALNAELINEVRKANAADVAAFGIKTITEEGLNSVSTALVQGTLPDPNLLMERVIKPIMTAATPLLIKEAVFGLRQEFTLVMSAARAFSPLLADRRVLAAYNACQLMCKDWEATDREKQVLATEFIMTLREALGLPHEVPAEKIAAGIADKIFSQLDMLEENFGASLTRALLIGTCALINTTPDILTTCAQEAAGALEGVRHEATALATDARVARELNALMSAKLVQDLARGSLQNAVTHAVTMVTGDDMRAYARALASGVVPNADNFFKRAIAALMTTTTAPLIRNAIQWIIQEPAQIALSLMHTLNVLAPLLDKPKVKAAYERMYQTFTNEAASQKDKNAAASAFNTALKRALCAEYPYLYLTFLSIDRFDPIAIIAKKLAKNVAGQLDILEETLGTPIAQVLASNAYKEFLKRYLSITLKCFILTLVPNYLSFRNRPLTREEEYALFRNAVEFGVLKMQALPAPMVEGARSALTKGIEAVRVFRGDQVAPHQAFRAPAKKANLLFRFIYGSYKVMEAAVQETFSFLAGRVKRLQRGASRLLNRIARAAQAVLSRA